jgi:hypothetical protein
MEVGDHRVEVERLEFGGVVEAGPVGIGLRQVLVEQVEMELVRPPVAVHPREARRVARRAGLAAMPHRGALPLRRQICVHDRLPSLMRQAGYAGHPIT